MLTSSCLHAASSRSHRLYFLRLENEKIHSRLGIFDLRSSPFGCDNWADDDDDDDDDDDLYKVYCVQREVWRSMEVSACGKTYGDIIKYPSNIPFRIYFADGLADGND